MRATVFDELPVAVLIVHMPSGDNSMAEIRASLSSIAVATASKFAFTSFASATVPLTKICGTVTAKATSGTANKVAQVRPSIVFGRSRTHAPATKQINSDASKRKTRAGFLLISNDEAMVRGAR